MPRILTQVRPRYTFEALQARVEGKVLLSCVVDDAGNVGAVRIVRSLDAITGLDEEAVTAAKQWTFAAGTKDGVAVPVVVTIELTFLLRDSPAGPIGWPDGFAVSSGTTADPSKDSSEWKETVLDAGDLRIRVSSPATWHVSPTNDTRLFLAQSMNRHAIHAFEVRTPRTTRVQLRGPASVRTLQQFADGLKQNMSAAGHESELRGTGQTQVGKRVWMWVDTWVPSSGSSSVLAPEVSAAFSQASDGLHIWSFVTTEGDKEILLACTLITPRNISAEDTSMEVRSAGKTFVDVLTRISIGSRPQP